MARALAVALAAAAPAAAQRGGCRLGTRLKGTYADMSDGDVKAVETDGKSLIITPSGNNQTWKVIAPLDQKTCSAVIDFNVPNKPNPPPCNLTATLWEMENGPTGRTKALFEYTDPTNACKFGPAGSPLNTWVQLPPHPSAPAKTVSCPSKLEGVYGDMSDGDFKKVVVAGTDMTITPSGNNQTWEVHATVDPKTCSALIDFNVPNKPNPPPCKLVATLWEEKDAAGASKNLWEYTDPTDACKFGQPGSPLNTWVRYP